MFRIKMAIAKLEEKGKKFDTLEVGRLLFEGTTDNAIRINMSNLISGKTVGIKPKWVPILCEKLECSADFLFGIEKTKDDE